MSFLSIVGSQNHLSFVPNGRKWRERNEVLEVAQFTDTEGTWTWVSDKSVDNSGKWDGEMQVLGAGKEGI